MAISELPSEVYLGNQPDESGTAGQGDAALAQLRQKYPEYDKIPDPQLKQLIVDRYPQYGTVFGLQPQAGIQQELPAGPTTQGARLATGVGSGGITGPSEGNAYTEPEASISPMRDVVVPAIGATLGGAVGGIPGAAVGGGLASAAGAATRDQTDPRRLGTGRSFGDMIQGALFGAGGEAAVRGVQKSVGAAVTGLGNRMKTSHTGAVRPLIAEAQAALESKGATLSPGQRMGGVIGIMQGIAERGFFGESSKFEPIRTGQAKALDELANDVIAQYGPKGISPQQAAGRLGEILSVNEGDVRAAITAPAYKAAFDSAGATPIDTSGYRQAFLKTNRVIRGDLTKSVGGTDIKLAFNREKKINELVDAKMKEFTDANPNLGPKPARQQKVFDPALNKEVIRTFPAEPASPILDQMKVSFRTQAEQEIPKKSYTLKDVHDAIQSLNEVRLAGEKSTDSVEKGRGKVAGHLVGKLYDAIDQSALSPATKALYKQAGETYRTAFIERFRTKLVNTFFRDLANEPEKLAPVLLGNLDMTRQVKRAVGSAKFQELAGPVVVEYLVGQAMQPPTMASLAGLKAEFSGSKMLSLLSRHEKALREIVTPAAVAGMREVGQVAATTQTIPHFTRNVAAIGQSIALFESVGDFATGRVPRSHAIAILMTPRLFATILTSPKMTAVLANGLRAATPPLVWTGVRAMSGLTRVAAQITAFALKEGLEEPIVKMTQDMVMTDVPRNPYTGNPGEVQRVSP